jgi:hypothetical protein
MPVSNHAQYMVFPLRTKVNSSSSCECPGIPVGDRYVSTDTQSALTRPDCTVSHSKQVAFRLDTRLEEFVPGTAGPAVSRRPERYAVETFHITGHEDAVIAWEAPVLAKLDA